MPFASPSVPPSHKIIPTPMTLLDPRGKIFSPISVVRVELDEVRGPKVLDKLEQFISLISKREALYLIPWEGQLPALELWPQ